jgi:folate-binding Fe-S cluster repair protein YgfZ
MTAVFVEEGPDKGAIWHFGEPNKEQKALLEGKAWADLSHLAVIEVRGEDRLKWLHDLTTQHLVDFGVGIWTSALILDPQGHVEYQFSLVDDGEATFIVIDPHFAETLINYLNKMRFMLKVEVRDATAEYAVLRAPGAANEVGGPFALVPRNELEEMKATFDSTAMQVGTWALDAERVAAGRPRHGIDTDFKAIPNELGVIHGAVHMNKGCYRGTPVMNGENQVGFLGTVARHHELGPIALAIVKRNTPVDAELTVEGVAASQQIIVEA